MLPYSARKKKANTIEEYSKLNPATSSASASGRSKGARFVSAITETKNIIATGSIGNKKIIAVCAATISVNEIELADKKTGSKQIEIETSYDIIWALDRKPPKNEYLELLDHPAIITVYTFSEDIANNISTLYMSSKKIDVVLSGRKAHPKKLRNSATVGAKKYKYKLTFVGIKISLFINLKPSAIA